MKILIITPYFFEPHRWMISAYKTALALSKKHEVVVLTAGKEKFKKINKNLTVYGMWDIFLPDPVNYSIVPGLLFHILKVIKKENPDQIIVSKFMFYTSFSIFWLRLMGKKVITVTDTFPGINWFPKNKFVKIIMWLYARVIGLPLLKISNKIVLLHEDLENVAKKYRLPYSVIHNGVDIDIIQKAQPIESLNLKNKIKVAYIGRLESVKGYTDLLKVAEKITKINKDVVFYFVGNSIGKEDIIEKYQSNQIIFLGHREDVASILKSSDIFALTSYSEGLPNSLMEAMAAGLACISSNVGGVKILLKNDANGLTYKAGDLKELENKLIILIKDPALRKRIGDQASKTIRDSFSLDSTAMQYERLFQEMK